MTGRLPEIPRLDHRIGLALNRGLMRPFFKRPRVLLVLGVMRSGTSLVTNILTSNPEIAGFGESHIIYDNPSRFADLRYWVFRYTRRYPGPSRILLDKVLHSDYTPDLPTLARESQLQVLFLIREPAATGTSLLRMYEQVRHVNAESIDVWGMLAARYQDLMRLGNDLPRDVPVAALSYEALLEAPDEALGQLTEFLGLQEPLKSTYEVPRWAGRWGVGDGSSQIRSGRIEPRPRATQAPANAPAEVVSAHQRLSDVLAARADPPLL